ncbi:MAG: YbaB/EbfC family nucleoid-associated protein, partial [Rickettsiales bacterium]|nr:YbaB/EbfC family nucleoid-associated protein [Rickettsiales bacterium]
MVDINQLVAQAREMQNRVKLAQEELAKTDVTGEAGGGLVKIMMTCVKETKKVAIDKSLLKADEKETLEDLLTAAFNNAKEKAEEIA